MDENDIKIISRETSYRGFMKVETVRLQHRRFAGGWMHEIKREIVRRGSAVAVVLYDPGRDAVVLIEQFRIGSYVAGRKPWSIEIVAGLVEPGESPADVARREAKEEAGCEILDLVPFYDFVVSPGCIDETVSMFCGRVDTANVGGNFGLPDEGEDIRVIVTPFEAAWADLQAGGLANTIAVVGMMWLKINRDDLRARWLK